MKKTIIALTLVVAMAIALSVTIPTLAATSGTDVVTITGTVTTGIEVTPTTATIALSSLSPVSPLTAVNGTTTVTVKCNGAWTLKATDTTTGSTSLGHMMATGPLYLTNYLSVSSNGSGSPTGNLATALQLNSGAHTSGTSTLVTVSQLPDWADAAGSYTMTMTLTGTTP